MTVRALIAFLLIMSDDILADYSAQMRLIRTSLVTEYISLTTLEH